MRSIRWYPLVLSVSKGDDRCGSTSSLRAVARNRSNYSAWHTTRALLVATAACAAAPVLAQPAPPQQPTVTVTASATATIANDRLQAWLRAEAENASAAAAASQVNATIGRALAEAKVHASIKVATAGYSTQQVSDKVRAQRWRVVQTISVEGGDFASAAALISRLQDEQGLLLSGMGFSLAEKTRRDAEEFFDIAPRVPIKTETERFSLEQANEALDRLRNGRLTGAHSRRRRGWDSHRGAPDASRCRRTSPAASSP